MGNNPLIQCCQTAKNNLSIFRGINEILRAMLVSIWNLKHVTVLALFSLFVFAVLGLHLYMGILTQKCIRNFSEDLSMSNDIERENKMWAHNSDPSNWKADPGVCGNWTIASCDEGYTCLGGYATNPDYGYTNFDSFGWSLLSTFRLMTQDFWESILEHVLGAAGLWHASFFIAIIFFYSFYLANLIVTIVVLSYKNIAKNTGDKERADDVDHPNQGHGCEFGAVNCSSFQNCVRRIVLNQLAEFLFTLNVLLNVLLACFDDFGNQQFDGFRQVLHIGNKICQTVYIVEAVLKIIAMGPKTYFKIGNNILSFFLASLCLFNFILDDHYLPTIMKFHIMITVIVYFRMVRVLLHARRLGRFNLFIRVIWKSIGSLSSLIFVLFLICTIYALLGTHLFSNNYLENAGRFPGNELPRWNFTDFWHSFMVLFRVICGEWIETMWDCMLVGNSSCLVYYIPIVIIGHLVALTLFVAILLYNYETEIVAPHTATTEVQAIRLAAAFDWVRTLFVSSKITTNHDTQWQPGVGNASLLDSEINFSEDELRLRRHASDEQNTEHGDMVPLSRTDEVARVSVPPTTRQLKFLGIVQHRYYELVVIGIVCLSSIFLTLEDIHLKKNPGLKVAVNVMDRLFTLIFLVEMIVKSSAQGIKKYFEGAWNRLDFVIVVVTVFNVGYEFAGFASIPLFSMMRSLRVVRILNSLSRWEGMRIVLNTLSRAIHSILCVILVTLLVWLVYAMLGMQFFSGRFYKCIDQDGNQSHGQWPTLLYDAAFILSKTHCQNANYTWENSAMNFDHLGNAYLSLLQVATFKGWLSIKNDAIDSTMVDVQPLPEVNFGMYIYFVLFTVFGSLVTRSLFTVVLIDKLKENLKMIGNEENFNQSVRRSKTIIPEPTWRPQLASFKLVMSPKFEMFFMFLTFLNALAMAVDHRSMSMAGEHILTVLNDIFILCFVVECVIKIFSLRGHYFHEPWNCYDFVAVVLSLLGTILNDVIAKYLISPTLLRLGRFARLGRVIRPLKFVKGIRILLDTWSMSWPAIFSTCLLNILVMFLYSIIGMSLFKDVKLAGGLNSISNFKTFYNSMILLFVLSTGAGWDGVLDGLRTETDCELPEGEFGQPGNCGHPALAISFLVSYLFLSVFIIKNLATAIVFGSYSQIIKNEDEKNDHLQRHLPSDIQQ